MSSYRTEATSTTNSLINLPFPPESTTPARTAVIACGALGPSIREIVERRGWNVDVHLMPALLHNRPHQIAPRVERLAHQLQERGDCVVLAYADCGTYGALDELGARLGIGRLRGQHCYDVFAGSEKVRRLFEDQPGTYLLTDFLVRSFRRTVLSELGLDRHPELWNDYFAHYERLVWLAQRPDDEMHVEARAIADLFALPLEVRHVGTGSLELELEDLLARATLDVAPGSRTEVHPRA